MVFILWLYDTYLIILKFLLKDVIHIHISYLYIVFKSMICYGSYSIILWFIYDNFVIFLISNLVVYIKHRVIQIQKLFD